MGDTPQQVTGRCRRSAYGLRVGTTGLIFAAIAIAWLAYLVPHFVRRREDEVVEDVDPASRFSESMRILRRGTAPLLDQDLTQIESYEVSTPLTRRAAVGDLRRLEAVAARRRRRVLGVLLLVLAAVSALALAGLVASWLPVVPALLTLVFVVVARVSVRGLTRSLDARYARIRAGGQERTVVLSRRDVLRGGTHRDQPAEVAARAGVLWDPVPITLPTYVSKPLAPRTVRTIDLSGPAIGSSPRGDVPVTADAPVVASPALDQRRDDDLPEAASA